MWKIRPWPMHFTRRFSLMLCCISQQVRMEMCESEIGPQWKKKAQMQKIEYMLTKERCVWHFAVSGVLIFAT